MDSPPKRYSCVQTSQRGDTVQVSTELNKLAAYSPEIQKSVESLNLTIAKFTEQLQSALSGLAKTVEAEQQGRAANAPMETASSVISTVLGSLQSSLATSPSALQGLSGANGDARSSATPQLVASTTGTSSSQRTQEGATTLPPGEAGAGLPSNYMN